MKYQLLSIIAISIIGTMMIPNAFSEDEEKIVVLDTRSGVIIIEFFTEDAPNTIDNFLELVDSGYYDRTLFHRVINGFMIQGGDPNTEISTDDLDYDYDSGFTFKVDSTNWGTGGPGYSIAAEFNTLEHDRGIVSMARSAHPDSAGSQFFIVHQDSNFLDGEYTVFGRIITPSSFETLDIIANLETGNRDIPTELGKAEIIEALTVPKSSAIPFLDQHYGIEPHFMQYAFTNKIIEGDKVVDNTPDRMITQELFDEVKSSQESEGGGCLIATAAFGSEMAPQVQFLRELRDNTVLQTESGISFMTGFNQFYYSFSPAIADYERENPAFKEVVKLTLTPLLTSLTLLQYADIDSESEMLGYGIGVILLNIGMYFVAPAVLIMKVRKRN
jgi:cyclophilin family peptidyl-prolyl cis-trans isomerase